MPDPLNKAPIQRGQPISAAFLNAVASYLARLIVGGKYTAVRTFPNGRFCIDYTGPVYARGGGRGADQTHWIVENETELDALTDMEHGHTGYTKDNDHFWTYDGTNWVCISHYSE